ncbi:MAG: hypothetical protein BGO97_14685 [Micrococcales bacterium 70-64]|nr:hypothetical protein [Leifsonia sp.]ODU65157.1 MAG: hypothetical protein ABT06_14685 [Leifsonia sp. SCN 70-46]OJX86849.1 MAG: hypothetical protein BGO97_14685 [Micrococcales bacterium 70-64]
MIGADGPATQRCSRAGCGTEAVFAVHWRNPRIHGEDRVKTWLACDEHVGFLSDYLASRDFPVTVTPVGEAVERV